MTSPSPEGVAQVAAAQADAMAACQEYQSHMAEPMSSAEMWDPEPVAQPWVPPEPGDGGGVT
jgi:hypothetical protein